MWVFIAPPVDLEPAVLRHDGTREAWAQVCLLAPAIDCVDGLLLAAQWRVFQAGERVMSIDSMKAVVMGRRHGGSHAGMGS